MSGSGSIEASSRNRSDLREPSIVFGIFLVAAWLLPLLPHTVLLQSVVGAGAVAALFVRIARSGEPIASIGVRADNLLPASAVFLLVTGLLAAPALWHGRGISLGAGEIFRYFLWALFQQFLVVAGFWRNFRRNAFLTALVFSLAHAPNLPLMALVLVAETVWLLLFSRFRNLLSFALAHALAALAVSHALVPDWLPSLRIGLHYLEP